MVSYSILIIIGVYLMKPDELIVEAEALGYTIAKCAIADCNEMRNLERWGDAYLCQEHFSEMEDVLSLEAKIIHGSY